MGGTRDKDKTCGVSAGLAAPCGAGRIVAGCSVGADGAGGAVGLGRVRTHPRRADVVGTGVAVIRACRAIGLVGPSRRAYRRLAGLALPIEAATGLELVANVAARLAVLEAVRAAVHVTDESTATLSILDAPRLRQGGGGLTLLILILRQRGGERA